MIGLVMQTEATCTLDPNRLALRTSLRIPPNVGASAYARNPVLWSMHPWVSEILPLLAPSLEVDDCDNLLIPLSLLTFLLGAVSPSLS